MFLSAAAVRRPTVNIEDGLRKRPKADDAAWEGCHRVGCNTDVSCKSQLRVFARLGTSVKTGMPDGKDIQLGRSTLEGVVPQITKEELGWSDK